MGKENLWKSCTSFDDEWKIVSVKKQLHVQSRNTRNTRKIETIETIEKGVKYVQS